MSAQPETVGRFRISAPLRAGEGGRLLAATDLDTDRRVILRLFARDSDDWRRAFMARTAQLTRLQHPHLARVLAGGTDATRAWWVYDHESVSTFADLLASETSPPLDRRLSLLAEICRGAAYAWASGVTFLDLRPPWLWTRADGSAIVAGYKPPAIEGREIDTGMDHLDMLRYASPEEVLGTPQDARSGVFTVGMVLYEAVTGRRLFDGDRLVDVAQQILYGKVPSLVVPSRQDQPGRGAAATAALAPVLARALARRPEDRFVSLADLADCLDAIARDLRDAASATAAATPSPTPPSSPLPVYDEHVQFTVYRPKRLAPGVWATLLVFAHLDALPPDAAPDAPDPIEEVQRQARALLGDTSSHGQQTVDSSMAVPREGTLTVVPSAEGITFNPPSAAFQWVEPVHREEFRMRAGTEVVGTVVRGRVSVFLGSIILADIPLTIRVDDGATADDQTRERTSARPYRRIFASYSHSDTHVVEEFARYADALGDKYLRDVVDLRSGERWNDALKHLIREADVFQLFWSWNALHSPYVRDEWQYALGLGRPSFIRPVYWDDPLPSHGELPPPSLRALHFERIRPVSVPVARPTGAEPMLAPAAPTVPAGRGPAPVLEHGPRADAQAPRPTRMRVIRSIGSIAALLLLAAMLWPAVRQFTLNAPAIVDDTPPAGTSGGGEPTAPAPIDSQVTDPSPPPPPPPPPPPLAASPDASATTSGVRQFDIQVRSADGAPLANALVELQPVGSTAGTTLYRTDARGRVTLRLNGNTPYTVVVTHGGHRPVTRAIRANTSTETMTVTLPALGDGREGV